MGISRVSKNISILIVVLAFANCEITLHIEKFYCIVHNPAKAQNVSCWLKPINRTITLINVRFNAPQKVNNVFINIQLYKKAEIVYRPYLVNTTFNYCDLMAKKFSSAYTRIITPLYMPFSNLNHTCPYYGPICVKDLIVDKNKLSFWPPGNYRIDILISEGKAKGLTFQIFLTVTN